MDLQILHEIWEDNCYTPALSKLSSGGALVDIGAHIGLFAIYAFRNLRPSRIICVEPSSHNLALLSRNLRENGVSCAMTYGVAIAGESGNARISIDPYNSGGHTLVGQSATWEPVTAMTLEDLFDLAEISKCSLLKMDCEGAELDILDKASDSLLRKISVISFEYHLDAYGKERLSTLAERLETLGFVLKLSPSTETLGIFHGTNSDTTSSLLESELTPKRSS
jgi:FkbM family methyltransferase